MKKEIKSFIEEVNSTEYLENMEDNNLDKDNENINIKELELKLGKPFQKCKDLKRRLERINNISLYLKYA